MPFTGQLGTVNSTLANIILGLGSDTNLFDESCSDTITFTEAWAGWNLHQTITETLTFSDAMSAFKVSGEGFDTLTFTEALSHAGSMFFRSTSDTLTFTDDVHQTHPVDITDSLTLTDDAAGVRKLDFAGSDTLTITETLARQFLAERTINEGLPFTEVMSRKMVRLRALSESLTLSDSAVGTRVRVTSDTLTLTENLTEFIAKLLKDVLDFESVFSLNAIFQKPANDVFEMYDSIFLNTYMRLSLSETLTFTDVMTAARVKPTSDSVTFTESVTGVASKLATDILTLAESLSVSKVKHVSASDSMVFSDSRNVSLVLVREIQETLILLETYLGIRVKFGVASDSVSFTDLLVREVHVVTAPDVLTFSDAVTHQKIGAGVASDTLTFADTIFVNTVISRTLIDAILFQEKPPADTLPSSAISIPDVPTGAYGTVANKMMVFIGQSRSVVITPPEFNDYASDRNQVIFKRKMDASVTTFIKTCKDEKLHFEFLVPKPKADEFRAFLDAENGRSFTIYDWNGYVWVAKLLTDTIDKEEVARWEPSGNKTRISVEFLGRRYA